MLFVDYSLALLLVVSIIVLSGAIAALSLAPWVPTRKRDIERGLTLSGLKPGERFYDLGCGDGRVVIEAAKRGAEATGFEVSLGLYAACRVRQAFGTGSKADFRYANLFDADLSDADVVYVYGTPDPIKKRLLPKLQSELKPGARVVSYMFKFDPWEPAAVDRMDAAGHFPIYLYIR